MTRVYECNAWQDDASIITANSKLTSSNANDDRSYFYVRIVVDFSTYLIEEEDGYGLPIRTLKDAEAIKRFEIPADDLLHEGTCSSTISNMLSAMDIPEEAHPDMADRIAHCARAMAKDNVGIRKVLRMIVHIFVEDYVVDDDGSSSTGTSTGDDIDDSVSEESEEAVEIDGES